MFKGNVLRVQADIQAIVRRLRKTGVTIGELIAEYRCNYRTLVREIRECLSEDQYQTLMRKRHRPNSGCFAKGSIPWNKGRKGWCPEECRATQFQPGQVRGNAARKYRSIGSVTIRWDKPKSLGRTKRKQASRWIKVRDDGPLKDRYVPLAQYLWEKAHGPIPEGCFIVHADHNRMNDALDNLLCVNRREHMQRLYQRPDVIAKCRAQAGRAAAKRHAQNRAAKKTAQARRRLARIVWECPDCGAEFMQYREQCPKCQSSAVEQRIVEPLPESMTYEAAARELAEVCA